jgi:hypothetical protein
VTRKYNIDSISTVAHNRLVLTLLSTRVLARAPAHSTSRTKSAMPTQCTRIRATVRIAISVAWMARLRQNTATTARCTDALPITKARPIAIP